MITRTIFFLSLFFSYHISRCQEDVTITAYTDKSRIVIGERLKLTVDVFIPSGRALDFPLTDTIDHFEFISSPRIDTTEVANGTEIRGVYTLTSFDSGHWVIPPFAFSQSLASDTIPVDVVFTAFDPSQDYHDLKEIIEVEPEEKNDQWWYFAGAGILLLLIVLAYLLRKKKKPNIEKPVIITDPYLDAMKDLSALQSSGVDAREFHSRLSDIFRLYIYRKQGILSLQKTTEDLVMRLADINISRDDFDRISQALRLGDFVKFAKFIPSAEDDREAFQVVGNTITIINKIPSKVEVSKG